MRHARADKCQAAHDVRAAQQAMALANTFFRESNTKGSGGSGGEGEGERREYLLPLVKAHPIWQERRLWEDSLMLSVADQLELCPQVRPSVRACMRGCCGVVCECVGGKGVA